MTVIIYYPIRNRKKPIAFILHMYGWYLNKKKRIKHIAFVPRLNSIIRFHSEFFDIKDAMVCIKNHSFTFLALVKSNNQNNLKMVSSCSVLNFNHICVFIESKSFISCDSVYSIIELFKKQCCSVFKYPFHNLDYTFFFWIAVTNENHLNYSFEFNNIFYFRNSSLYSLCSLLHAPMSAT